MKDVVIGGSGTDLGDKLVQQPSKQGTGSWRPFVLVGRQQSHWRRADHGTGRGRT